MSKFLNYTALFLAIAIVFLLVRGPIDWAQFTVFTEATSDLIQDGTADRNQQAALQPVAIDLTRGDVTEGADLYRRRCQACHSTKPQDNGVGPSLYGVIGRQAGSVAGFEYSRPMAQLDLVWTADTLGGYLTDPRGFLPGTTMSYNGLSDTQDIADILAYLDAIAVN